MPSRKTVLKGGSLPRSRKTPSVPTDAFSFCWHVDAAGYEWEKDATSNLHLVARHVPGTRLNLYYPLEKNPGLFREFSALRGKEGILQFANRYGTLFLSGYSLPNIHPQVMTSLDTWEMKIADMRMLVRLWESIVDGDVRELAHIVKWEITGVEGVGYNVRRKDAPPSTWLWLSNYGVPCPFKRGDVLLPAQYALQAEVNARLRNTENGLSIPTLTWTPDQKQRITITPPNLLAGMWLQFAQAVTGSYQLKRCPGCGNYFQAGLGARRSDAETCSNTCRQRKARKGGTKTRGKN